MASARPSSHLRGRSAPTPGRGDVGSRSELVVVRLVGSVAPHLPAVDMRRTKTVSIPEERFADVGDWPRQKTVSPCGTRMLPEVPQPPKITKFGCTPFPGSYHAAGCDDSATGIIGREFSPEKSYRSMCERNFDHVGCPIGAGRWRLAAGKRPSLDQHPQPAAFSDGPEVSAWTTPPTMRQWPGD